MTEEKILLKGERRPRTGAEIALQEQFDRWCLNNANSEDNVIRQASFTRFAQSGLPDRKVEEWCYTDLRKVMDTVHEIAQEEDAIDLVFDRDADIFSDLTGCRLIIANGRLQDGLSDLSRLPAGVEIVSGVASASARPMEFADGVSDVIGDLNRAFAEEQIVLRIGSSVKIDEPLHLVILSGGRTALSAHSRIWIDVGAGAELTLLETCMGTVDSHVTHVVEFSVGEGASLEHIRLQNMPEETQFFSIVNAHVSMKSCFNSFLFVSGGTFSRSETRVRFIGENATANVSGAMLLSGSQFGDANVFVDHALPHCHSRESYKFVLDDLAHGVFQGKILVRPHAQKTDGKQSSHALLLSEGAEMNAKPELAIYADDVQCGHASTLGSLDEVLIFYLRSRGIPEKNARAMLVLAFVNEVMENIVHDGVRQVLSVYAERLLSEQKTNNASI